VKTVSGDKVVESKIKLLGDEDEEDEAHEKHEKH
jgi:hypothetical protein